MAAMVHQCRDKPALVNTLLLKHESNHVFIKFSYYKNVISASSREQHFFISTLQMRQTLEEKSSIHMLCYTQTYTPQTDLQCLVQQCFLTLSETGPSGNCFSMTTHKRPSPQDQHHKRYQLHYPGNYILTP